MNKIFVFLVCFTLPFALTFCNQTSEVDLKTQGSLEKISFTDQGCVDLAKSITHLVEGEDALQSWKYEEGILKLNFLFNSTCGSQFIEESKVSGSVLEIVLTDTADGHAKCTCDFMEIFSFSVQGTNQVQVIFSIKPYPNYQLTKLVDRVITF